MQGAASWLAVQVRIALSMLNYSTRIYMRKHKRPYKYTHCVYSEGEKIASIRKAFGVFSIVWHVDYFQSPRYGAICRAILEAAKHVDSFKNVLIYEQRPPEK